MGPYDDDKADKAEGCASPPCSADEAPAGYMWAQPLAAAELLALLTRLLAVERAAPPMTGSNAEPAVAGLACRIRRLGGNPEGVCEAPAAPGDLPRLRCRSVREIEAALPLVADDGLRHFLAALADDFRHS